MFFFYIYWVYGRFFLFLFLFFLYDFLFLSQKGTVCVLCVKIFGWFFPLCFFKVEWNLVIFFRFFFVEINERGYWFIGWGNGEWRNRRMEEWGMLFLLFLCTFYFSVFFCFIYIYIYQRSMVAFFCVFFLYLGLYLGLKMKVVGGIGEGLRIWGAAAGGVSYKGV